MKKFLLLKLMMMAHFSYAQTFDSFWNSNGKVDLTDTSAIYSSIFDSHGRVYSCGKILKAGVWNFYVEKRLSNGYFDNTFGLNGKLIFNIPNNISHGIGNLEFDKLNRLILVGGCDDVVSSTRKILISAITLDSGKFIKSFGINGIALLDPTAYIDNVLNVSTDNSGNIYVCGSSEINVNNQQFLFVKVSSNGTIDNTFGVNGVVTGVSTYNQNRLHDILVDNNKIIAVGTTVTGGVGGDGLIIRLNANGTYDNTFDTDGKLTVNVNFDDCFYSIIKASDNNYYIGGQTYISSWNALIVCINNTGAFVPSFDSDGKAVYTSYPTIHNLTQDNQGKLLLSASYGGTNNNGNIRLSRINLNGTYDNTFGTNGTWTFDAGETIERTEAVLVDMCDNIYISGYKNTTKEIGYIYRLSTKTMSCPCYNVVYDTVRTYSKIVVTDTLRIEPIIGLNTIPSNFGLVKLYPNPARDIINISTSNPSLTYSLKIYNAASIEVYSTILNNANTQINRSVLGNTGMYIIQILDAGGNILETKKLILE